MWRYRIFDLDPAATSTTPSSATPRPAGTYRQRAAVGWSSSRVCERAGYRCGGTPARFTVSAVTAEHHVPRCDTCLAPVFVEGDRRACPRDPAHDTEPLQGMVVGTREQPCATCVGHVVYTLGTFAHPPSPFWCRVDSAHEVG
jgi:hypothetical protein